MTLSRRSFSFASLAALFGTSTARAAPQAQQQAAGIPELDGPPPSPAPATKVTPSLVREGGELVVTVAVHNEGAEPTSVLVAFGARPAEAPVVTLVMGGSPIELAPVLGEVDRREMMSRMGPVPRWAEVVAGASVTLGPYRYALPKGAEPPVAVRGTLHTAGGAVPYAHEGLTWSGKAS